MKRLIFQKQFLFLTLFSISAFNLFAQGPLDPPGPPAATGKSLQEIFDESSAAKAAAAAATAAAIVAGDAASGAEAEAIAARTASESAAANALLAIDPRSQIRNADLPFTISEAGSYVFAENLNWSTASGIAITIAASNVTLDLKWLFTHWSGKNHWYVG